MKDIMIVVLILLLFITILYLVLLKRGIQKFDKEIEKKVKNNSNTLLTTGVSDKDLCNLVDSINNILESYNDVRVNYENKNNNLQKMITNIAHDIRTPLTSALGYIDLVLKSEIDEETKIKNLKIIEERLLRLSELVDSFFEFSKIISSNEEIEFTDLNMIAVLEKSMSNHYEDFSKDNRIIHFHTDQRKVSIRSNEIMLSRIFDNLIRNAYKHSKGDLTIQVTTKKKIEVSFENELLYLDLNTDRIFDEFYTIDISRTKGNTGLGLAIAKEFTNQLNGEIRAEKKENTLRIELCFDKTMYNFLCE